MSVQSGLCQTWSEIPKTGFVLTRLISIIINIVIFHYNACFVAPLFSFRCNVKMTGILMMSFPAGVVRVFMENPNPTMLSFRIKNASRLEQVLINKQLITE